ILLGMLASYALDRHVKWLLDSELRASPLGFRVWRAITKLVLLNARSAHTDAPKAWVRRLIGDSEDLRKSSLSPGRSLDLELAIEQQIPVCNDWPDGGNTWFRNVQVAADQLDRSDDLPEHLRPGAKNLFKHMILQNASVYRRQAIETVVTSGWTEPVATALK